MVEMPSRRPVGAVDTMWLNMDRPNNLMVIDAVMWFDEPVDWDRLTMVVQHRLLERYPVFRQRPVGSAFRLGLPCWEDDPDFSLRRHLIRTRLPAPGDEPCLQRFVEDRMHEPFDRTHPLWQFHLVDGYRDGSAIVTRFHHALADGIALAEVLLSLTDPTPSTDLEALWAGASELGRRTGRITSMLGAAPVRGAAHLVSALPRLARPSTAVEAVTLTRQAGHVFDKLLLRSNPVTPLTGRPGVAKRAVWTGARPVSEVRRVGRLAGATVNDVLVGAVSGAISTYLVQHGGDPTDLTTMVPVNLRAVGEPLPAELGNKFALVLLPLPTGSRSPVARLAESKRRMDTIKHSPESAITFGLITAIGCTPSRVERAFVDFFSSRAFGVTTNVMGPVRDRFVAGSRVAGVLGWVPGSGRQTLGVSIFSYNQSVRVGFKADAGVVPDPERLVAAFDHEMDDLVRMARAV